MASCDLRNASLTATNVDDQGSDRSARLAGVLLLATAAATVVMVFTRVSADADQETLLASLLAVDESRVLYGTSAVARAVSGLTLSAAAFLLLKTWIIRDRWATPLVPYLFALSGVFTVLSGAFAFAIAVLPAPEVTVANGVASGVIAESAEVLWGLRWVTGKVGFTAAGLAVIVAARYQWQVGGTLRIIAPFSAVIGVAMQFIWLDAATVIHPVIGTAFFLWLIAVGTMLSTGRVERHFVTRYGAGTA